MAEDGRKVQLRPKSSPKSSEDQAIPLIVQSATKSENSSSSSSENQLETENESAQPQTTATTLEAITEEQSMTKVSDTNLLPPVEMPKRKTDDSDCICRTLDEYFRLEKERMQPEDIQKLLTERENELRAEYKKILRREIDVMRERFSDILRNEQTRSSFRLREAQRDRQEKIRALQSQLECKNLAALMYVMCTDRQESKLEKMRIIEEYTNYIHELQDILTEGQNLILHLSRGYKTAARVDHEWREKMKKMVAEFMAYIYHYGGGGSLDTVQYYFNLQELMTTKTSIVDDPKENPCEEEEVEEEQGVEPEKKEWYEQMGDDSRPFVMFGDLCDFEPPERRKVLGDIKAQKTAPKKWKEYVFKDMCVKQTCSNHDVIKDASLKTSPEPYKWSCQAVQTVPVGSSRQSLALRNRVWSVDVRNQMGSLLKIITAPQPSQSSPKTNLLGAKDSIEITSATKQRGASRSSKEDKEKDTTISIGKNKISTLFDKSLDDGEEITPFVSHTEDVYLSDTSDTDADLPEEYKLRNVLTPLGSIHVDSLHVLQQHSPEKDRILTYERACPMEKCQAMQVDSFIRKLPPYMQASPFTHFEQTFEEYELCSPEQLEILRKRLETRKSKEILVPTTASSVLLEWKLEGIATQTSEVELPLPPCTCVESPRATESNEMVLNFKDLKPTKQVIDKIAKDCFYDDKVEFNRFEVIGQDYSQNLTKETKEEFTKNRFSNIMEIMQEHPSLLEIFQANTR